MGKITLTSTQKHIISIIASDPYFPQTFYLTGGTVLSAFYYHHRQSEDIDFFTPKPFDQTFVQSWMNKQQKTFGWHLTYRQVFERQTYEISWKKHHGKIEFVHYDFKQIEKNTQTYESFAIDSKSDIGVNKLLTISQRTTTKDFVDLYFLLKKDFSWWDLMHGVAHKFGIEIDKIYLSSLLTKVQELDTLPIMKKKLTIEQLKTFFLKEAKRLAMTMVKP